MYLIAPAFYYRVSTGEFFENAKLLEVGYSGAPPCRNKSEYEHLPKSGPIPKGRYLIGRARFSERTGPVVLYLTPIGHDAHGRTGFQIHGDHKKRPGTASTGCIILSRAVRESVNAAVIVWGHIELVVTD